MNKLRGLWHGKTRSKRNGEAFNEIWVKGDLIHSGNQYYIHPIANSVKAQSELGELIVMHEVDPSTLGECTGLRDKNGKLIFEGDIVKTIWQHFGNTDTVIGFVKYDDAAFILETDDRYLFFEDNIFSYECEVIGNIHDSPELLKQRRPFPVNGSYIQRKGLEITI